MFATLIRLIAGRPPPDDEHNLFVEEVRVYDGTVRRNPRTVRFIFICWILIAVKHVLVIWACENYATPFHQLWVNFPTWLLGALATGIYFWRTRRQR